MHPVLENEVVPLINKKNYPMAEINLRSHLENEPGDYEAIYLLGYIAATLNLTEHALAYFNDAIKHAPEWQPAQDARKQMLERISLAKQANGSKSDADLVSEKFILIKAWGAGFWADVGHVLSQLLIAELTGRTPVVHWGANSLYGDGTSSNAFEFYFEPLSNVSVSDLQKDAGSIWPPKWNQGNLSEPSINTLNGPYSRVAGIYLLGRSEKTIVSDFYTSVCELRPWIPEDHHLYGLSIDELWKYLLREYLRPKKEILDKVDAFYKEHFGSNDYLAVHIRGSDKVIELARPDYLDEVHQRTESLINEYLSANKDQKIFLMTDDVRVMERIKKVYGDKVVSTNCQRTGDDLGVHYQPDKNGRKLGEEIMIDVYLAARASAFIGSGFTNPSLFVSYLKEWPEGRLKLIGRNMFHTPNPYFHKW